MAEPAQDLSPLSGQAFEASTAEVVELARQRLNELLDRTCGKTLILLSGGSVVVIYDVLVEAIKNGRGKRWHLGLIDERFGEEGHTDSNALAIEQKTGLISLCENQNISFQTILRQLPMGPTVSIYQHWLEQQLEVCTERIAILGLGKDGHTAGILPQSKLRFDQVFDTHQLVVGYSSGTEYDQRITVTPALLKQMTHTILLAYGSGKAEAFERANQDISAMALHEVPGALIQQLPEVQAFIGID